MRRSSPKPCTRPSQSGTFADYGNFGRGIQTIFDHYASKGMFTDSLGKNRSVEYLAKDDGYDPARTIPVVDELLDAEKTFAIWTLGSPSTLRTYEKINQRCVPHPLAMTAHPAWGDPVNHPWTTGAPNPAYSTEAVLWGGFIEDRLDSEFGGQVTVPKPFALSIRLCDGGVLAGPGQCRAKGKKLRSGSSAKLVFSLADVRRGNVVSRGSG